MSELQVTIVGGTVERDENGHIIAFLKTVGPNRSMQEMVERMGLDSFEMVCEDRVISTDRSTPSLLRYQNTITIPQGETITDLNT